MAELSKLFDAIVAGRLEDAVAVTQEAINEGVDANSIINEYMIPAMNEIGARFQRQEAFVPNLLMAARAMKGALELIKNDETTETIESKGKVVIGTVFGDLHDIGKNLVASMLEGCGYQVVNLGVNISAEQFVEKIKSENPDIICMSALLTTTMSYMQEVINKIEAEGLRGSVKIMVGGAPVNQVFADKIGADGYSQDANAAVALANRLIN